MSNEPIKLFMDSCKILWLFSCIREKLLFRYAGVQTVAIDRIDHTISAAAMPPASQSLSTAGG